MTDLPWKSSELLAKRYADEGREKTGDSVNCSDSLGAGLDLACTALAVALRALARIANHSPIANRHGKVDVEDVLRLSRIARSALQEVSDR